MNFESIISHMNDHHKSNLVDLCKKFGGIEQVQDVFLKSVDFNGLDLVYNDKENLRVEFPKKADENTIKDAIISLLHECKERAKF